MRHIFYIVMMLACALMSACGHYVPEVGPSVEPAMKTLVTEARDGYECRFVEFSVEPSERIKAYLLVPTVPLKVTSTRLCLCFMTMAHVSISARKSL